MRVNIDQAVSLLNAGDVVAVPTETVYGLAASLRHHEAISKIFSLKGRPSNNPLIVHLPSADQIELFANHPPPKCEKLMQAFWPGPMTLVLSINVESVPAIARANLSTAGFRVPAHPLTHALLERTGPLVMPSANLSGKPSATCAAHVEVDFGSDFPVLDGGQCVQGLESTILMWHKEMWKVIRLGALSPETLEGVLGYLPEVIGAEGEKPVCPGQMYRHYAPKANLKLAKDIPDDATGVVLGFSDRVYGKSLRVLSMGRIAFPEEVAQRLYLVLRQLDAEGIEEVWVDMNFPETGIWLTIRERLYKASGNSP